MTQKQIETLVKSLTKAQVIVSDILSKVQSFSTDITDKYDNLSERAMESERGERLEIQMDYLEEAVCSLEDVESEMTDAIKSLKELCNNF